MSFFPPDSNDPLDGRDPFIRKRYPSLRAVKPIHIETGFSGIVPYEDLQRSPSPIEGHFQSSFDKGILDICIRDTIYSQPKTVAVLTIRNDINSLGERVTLVSLQLPEDIDYGR